MSRYEPWPARPGAYVLLLRLGRGQWIKFARGRGAWFPAGWYAYAGQARGPGGLRARLGRHWHGPQRRHWHIDHLRAYAQPVGWLYTLDPSPAQPWECRWSQYLAARRDAFIPAPGFGASDCRTGCRAHLIAFPFTTPLEGLIFHLCGLTPRAVAALAPYATRGSSRHSATAQD
ncbi:MAG: GIY-YIG nuclease family protein [Chloroflexi bacterium]|nr:GIY-YIG nuclease family protein [Chloroflexota bacterium]